MKLYLDDLRPVPDATWVLVKTAEDAIQFLEDHPETHTVSVDHDLGEDENGEELTSGYEVLCWLEERVYNGGKIPKNIMIHSANTAARARMVQAINAINEFRGTCR